MPFFSIVRAYPSGSKKELEAINDGKKLGEKFIESYPPNDFEYAFAGLVKDSEEANVLIKTDFENKDRNYYFDYVYVR